MSAAPDVTIREAASADFARVLALQIQLAAGPSGDDTAEPLAGEYERAFAAIAGDARLRLFVVEADGAIVATATLDIVPNVTHRGRPYAIVENVVVDAAARGGGHGAALMRHLIEEARRAGCYKVVLTSAKRRRDAHRFYERLGFRVASEGFRMEL